MYLSWIIPAYNEEKRIGQTVREVDAYLRGKGFTYEVIVVNNNSRDRTGAIVERLRAEFPALRLVNAQEQGKGGAVKRGMREALGEIRLFSDADNSTSPQHFEKMEPLFAAGYDVVISSRDARDAPGAGRDVKEPWYREFLGKIGNLVIQAVGVWGIWDTQNGFKGFSARAAGEIFPRLRTYGWAFDIEVLAIARRLGYRMGVIPVIWRYEPDSKVTWRAYLEVLVSTFRIRWNILIGRYRPTPNRAA